MKKPLNTYFAILAFTALALGLSNDILHNYFKEVYHVTAMQRGFIELPRELPGMLLFMTVGILARWLSDIKMAMVAQVLSMIGILVLGFFEPGYGLMLFFIFVNSFGMHLFFPLQDSIGLSLVDEDQVGKRMGEFKGITTGFMMAGGLIVFVGFKTGLFSFASQIKWVFVLSGVLLFVVFLLFVRLQRQLRSNEKKDHQVRFVFRKSYKYYYVLVVMFGVQKQMMMVYGPWVLIELLSQGPETMALLGTVGAFIGIFFMPAIGRWMDRFGVKKILYADAISFIGVYFLYGYVSGGLGKGTIATSGLPVLLISGLYIIDKMSGQLGMVRSVYLKSILEDPSDLTPTLSLGISLDHVVSILCAMAGGLIWRYYGPQYVFYLVSALSFVNLYVAIRVKDKPKELA